LLFLGFLYELEKVLLNNQSISQNFNNSSTSSGFLGVSLVAFLSKTENKEGL
jgi:hypothetical protein